MQKEIKPTMKWKEAPDIIDYTDLAKILGVCNDVAKEIFDRRNFPKIIGTGSKRKAEKEAVILYLQGFYSKDNIRDTRQNLILLELRKINLNLNKMKGVDENDKREETAS